jgi:hypothetical protein
MPVNSEQDSCSFPSIASAVVGRKVGPLAPGIPTFEPPYFCKKLSWEFYHQGWAMGSKPNAIKPSNSQTTTFRVGELLLHTYSTTAPADERIDVNPIVFALKHGLCPIWPLTEMPYVPPNQLSSTEVNAIAHDLVARLGLPFVVPPESTDIYRDFAH